MELGLCCKFFKEPITFKTYTLSHIKKLLQTDFNAAREKVLNIIFHNIDALQQALDYCCNKSIRSFRVSSDLIPHLTNLKNLKILNNQILSDIRSNLSHINNHRIVLSMHPGQHVNMGSPSSDVINNSLQDLNEHFFIAEALGCREINIHVGGSYGNKGEAMERFIKNMQELIPADKLIYITIENDELNYSVEDIVYIAGKLGVRATYDIHHQRCYNLKNPSSKTEREYMELCRYTWEDYSYQRVHISSPKYGYSNITKSRPHHDFININDVPPWLLEFPDIHLDIEAKAKEQAIAELDNKLQIIYQHN